MQKLKLNIGCGLVALPGWINIDSSLNAKLAKWPWIRKILVALHILPLAKAKIAWPKNIYIYDVRRGLPFADNSIEAIYSSHFLEHLNRQDAIFFIKECYRVLDTQGIIRLITPDLAVMVNEYIKMAVQENRGVLTSEPPANKFIEALKIFSKEPIEENILFRVYKRIVYDKNTHKWIYDEYSLNELLSKRGFVNIQRKSCCESLIDGIEELDIPGRFNGAFCLEAQKLCEPK